MFSIIATVRDAEKKADAARFIWRGLGDKEKFTLGKIGIVAVLF